MRLHDLLTLYRQQILAACEAEQHAPGAAGNFARYVAEHFDAAVHAFEQSAAPVPVPPSASASSRHELLGVVPAITRVRFGIDQLSRRSRTPALFVGEFGTGKRHSARALHAVTYPEGEFFELDSAARLGELERRINALRTRTSPESAAGLSVYVHELSEAHTSIQLRLSQLLPEQDLRFRVIASSSRALTQAARDGSLRPDLVFRFPTTLELPPLRDRLADLPMLIQHFSEVVATRHGGAPTRFDSSAIERMEEYGWPGNLIELSNLAERLWQDFGSAQVGSEQLPELGERQSGAVFHLPRTGIDFADLERELLTQALTMADNNQTRAASLLGLTRDQLRYRLAKFEIAQRGVSNGSG